MHRRIQRFDRPRLERRAARGRLLARILHETVDCPGSRAATHSFWIFPAKFNDGEHVIAALRRFGFDSTAGSALVAVPAPKGRESLDPVHARQALSGSLCLPMYPEMPEAEVERLGRVLLDTVGRPSTDLSTSG
jgi:perosamine synthetase